MIQQVLVWLSPSATQNVALALTHSLWQGTLVAFALEMVLRVLRDEVPAENTEAAGRSYLGNPRAKLRYTVACLGLLVLAALPVANLLIMKAATNEVAAMESPVGQSESVAMVGSMHRPAMPESQRFGGELVRDEQEPTIAEAKHGGFRAITAPRFQWVRRIALQAFFWIWFIGVALLSIWHLIGWTLSRKLRERGIAPSDEVLMLVEKMALRLGVHRAIDVRKTSGATTPMVIGWIKPALILPARLLTEIAPRELEAVLAHELAHVRRNDYLVNLVQIVVETLMFYHPAVWWVSGRIRREREFCADDLALQVCERHEVYAQSLVAVAETAVAPASHAIAATGGSLLHRVHRILHFPEQPSPLPWSARCSAAAGLTAAIGLGVAMMAVAQNQHPDETPSFVSADISAGTGDSAESAEEPATSAEASPKLVQPGGEEALSESAAMSVAPVPTLEGIWRVVSMFNRGERIPNANVKGFCIEIGEKKLTMRLKDRVLAETDFEIDESTKPASIKMVFEGKPSLGILVKEGRRMSICLSGSEEQRPTKFISEDDSPNRMLIHLCWGEFPPDRPIWIANANGGNLRQLELPKGFACGSPDWSPDGKVVACDAWNLTRGEDYDAGRLTLVPVNGGEVTDLGPGAMPSWSPNGKRIAFCRYGAGGGVRVMDADGTDEELIDGDGWGVDWSPVGNEIAYPKPTSSGMNICIVDSDTEERRMLLESEEYRWICWNLSWSPDGKSICFVGTRHDGTKEVARVSAQGRDEGFKILFSTKTAPQYELIRSIVSWAGNSEQILVSMKGPEDRFRQLYVLDAEGEEPPKPFPGQRPHCENEDMAWSSDGKQVAYIRWEPD